MKKIQSLLLLSVFGFIACENQDVEVADSNLLEQNALATELVAEETEIVLDDIVMYSDSAFGIDASTSKTSTDKDSLGKNRGRSKFFKECASIVSEVSDGIVTTTITFDENCEDRHGNVISGTIVKVKTIGDASKEKVVTITDFSINGYVVNGTKTYTFVESNANGNPEMNGTVDMTIATEEGIRTKKGNRTVEITAGGDTDSCYDDEKTITGAAVYTNTEGLSKTVTITSPLVKPAECRYIASGVKTYEVSAGTVTLDFGDGTCDNVATKTAMDGTETEVRLGKKRKK
ncbi:hypothetical protein [Cognatitamlana onchidii]|uniref:hypothetical protein n=1 Tax=Cognatitamlana onchidii TaxID=2562860 RepID=UPI0010A5AFBC|nr:hypothetical protein [Algibacter onchidii]